MFYRSLEFRDQAVEKSSECGSMTSKASSVWILEECELSMLWVVAQVWVHLSNGIIKGEYHIPKLEDNE